MASFSCLRASSTGVALQRPRILLPQRVAASVRCQALPPAASAAVMAPLTPIPDAGSLNVVDGEVVCFNAPDLDSMMAIAAGRLVVVDVFTQWCGPCKIIAPELEKIAEELSGRVVMSKIDCTSNPDNKKWAMAQNVKALPTFILFKDGRRVNDMTGAKSANLRKLIDAHM